MLETVDGVCKLTVWQSVGRVGRELESCNLDIVDKPVGFVIMPLMEEGRRLLSWSGLYGPEVWAIVLWS